MTERYVLLSVFIAAAACSSGQGPAPPPRLADDAMAADFDRHRALFEKYLAIDTTNPPGNEARAFPLLSEALASIGLEAHTDPVPEERGNLWARLVATNPDPGAKPLILLHHIDVVPHEPERWSEPAFGAPEKDGKIYGRGAIDTKSLGILQLAALERLKKVQDKLRRDVVFLAVYDEEQNGSGAQKAIADHLEEWKPEYLLDEGGFGVRKMIGERDLCVIAVAQKRNAKMLLTASGEAGHGSRPIDNGGPNILHEALSRLFAAPPPLRLVPTTIESFGKLGELSDQPKRFLLEHLDAPGVLWALGGTLTANKNLNPQLRDTMSLTILAAGQKDNVIPAEAKATFDVRLLPDTDADAFLAERQKLLEGLSVKLEWISPPLPGTEPAPTADPLFTSMIDATRAHEPDAVVSSWLLVGANDSRFFAPKGVKTYGFLPVFLDKAQIDTIHGHDENVSIAELKKGLVVYAEALERFLVREP
jgi:acetylornithine deacetylase/succinyl-diaminopimelate desuccinylase-like protein